MTMDVVVLNVLNVQHFFLLLTYIHTEVQQNFILHFKFLIFFILARFYVFYQRILSNQINFKITLLSKVQDPILNFQFPRPITILYLTTNQISQHHFFKRGPCTDC